MIRAAASGVDLTGPGRLMRRPALRRRRTEGNPVWIGRISRDIGLSFNWKNIVIHEVEDGTPFFTDGLRAGMVFGKEPASLDQIRLLDWEKPPPR